MRSFILLGMAALSLTAAQAADLPVKVQPNLMAGYPYQGSGFYFGPGVAAEVLSSSIDSAAGGSGLYSAGAAVTGTIGYQFGMNSNWYAVEITGQYTNLGGAVSCTTGNCAVTSRWGFEQRAIGGFPTALIANLLPTVSNFFPALPALPNGIAVSPTSHPYLFVGLREDDISAKLGFAEAHTWNVRPTVGMGLRQLYKNGLVLDVSAGCTVGNSGIQIGGAGAAQATFGRDCRVETKLLF
jgi:opacity protein-like surface antigen